MRKNTKENVVYYTFNQFDKISEIKHCFSTKYGGVSEGYYSSMNLSFSRNDKKEYVLENYKRICNAVGFSHENIVFSDQVHDINLKHVDSKDRGKGILFESDIKNIDGIMTNEKDVILTTFYADCVPLYFYDKIQKAIALSHSGWKGTLNQIAKETIIKMKELYHSSPENILVGIGPSIHQCCFEVDKPVADEFLDKLDFAKQFIKPSITKENKFYIDLQGINRQILLNNGINAENIEESGLCTKCHSDIFYSHREDGSKRGSLAAFLCLI